MTFTRQVLDRPLQVRLTPLDDGVHILLTGGDRSHIGAVSLADREGDVRSLDFPGHREREVAEQWAAAAARVCGGPAAVTCGIHYDGLTPDGLSQVLHALDELLDCTLDELGRTRS